MQIRVLLTLKTDILAVFEITLRKYYLISSSRQKEKQCQVIGKQIENKSKNVIKPLCTFLGVVTS